MDKFLWEPGHTQIYVYGYYGDYKLATPDNYIVLNKFEMKSILNFLNSDKEVHKDASQAWNRLAWLEMRKVDGDLVIEISDDEDDTFETLSGEEVESFKQFLNGLLS